MQKIVRYIAWFESMSAVEFITNPLSLDFNHRGLNQNAARIYYIDGYEITADELRNVIKKRCQGFDESSVRLITRLLLQLLPADSEAFFARCRCRRIFLIEMLYRLPSKSVALVY